MTDQEEKNIRVLSTLAVYPTVYKIVNDVVRYMVPQRSSLEKGVAFFGKLLIVAAVGENLNKSLQDNIHTGVELWGKHVAEKD